MYIAQNKRKENIAEYILYLWQLEDLLRAMQFSPEAVFSTLIKPRGLDRTREQELLEWYMGVADLLRKEGKEEHGHLEHTLHLIGDMDELHKALLELPAGRRYRELWAPLSVELPALRKALGKEDISDIELCMRALYAVMLYRIKGQGEARQAYISDVMEVISPVIALLADIYRQVELGELDIYKKE